MVTSFCESQEAERPPSTRAGAQTLQLEGRAWLPAQRRIPALKPSCCNLPLLCHIVSPFVVRAGWRRVVFLNITIIFKTSRSVSFRERGRRWHTLRTELTSLLKGSQLLFITNGSFWKLLRLVKPPERSQRGSLDSVRPGGRGSGGREQEELEPRAAGAVSAETQAREDPTSASVVPVGTNTPTSFPLVHLPPIYVSGQSQQEGRRPGSLRDITNSCQAGQHRFRDSKGGDQVGKRGEGITGLCSPLMTEGPSLAPVSPQMSALVRAPGPGTLPSRE